MKRLSKKLKKTGGIQLAEEAFHLVRHCPGSILVWYIVGTCPFLLALLYFWADLTRGRVITGELPFRCLLLSLLFLTMKTFQSEYMSRMYCWLADRPAPSLSLKRISSSLMQQTIIQPWGLVVLPVCMVMTFPYAWAYAFFQNMTLYGNGTSESLLNTCRQATRRSADESAQNHLFIWLTSPSLLIITVLMFYLLTVVWEVRGIPGGENVKSLTLLIGTWLLATLSPIALMVTLNIMSLLMVGPFLLKSLLGIESLFSLSMSQMFNSTLLMSLLTLTYLILDPVLKAGYVIRGFRGDSLATGQDLLNQLPSLAPSRLKSFIMGGLIFTTLTTVSGRAEQTNAPLTPSHLNQSIEQVLRQREYNWRFPRDIVDNQDEKTFMDHFFSSISETVEAWIGPARKQLEESFEWISKHLSRWLRHLFDTAPADHAGGRNELDWITGVQALSFVLMAVVISATGVILYRIYRQRLLLPKINTTPSTSVPDLNDETVTADQLPENEWMALATKQFNAGDYRLAMRALSLATLSHLDERNVIRLQRHKSNRDYLREVKSQARFKPLLPEPFEKQIRMVETVWYGTTTADATLYENVRLTLEEVKAHAA